MNIWERNPRPLPDEIPDDRLPKSFGGVYVVEGSHSKAGGRWDVESIIGGMYSSWQTMRDGSGHLRPVRYERPIAIFAIDGEGEHDTLLYDNIPEPKMPEEVEEDDDE